MDPPAMALIGGVVGTYFSIKNTNGPRERAFMIRASATCWGGCDRVLGRPVAYPVLLPGLIVAPVHVPLALGHSRR